jgi:hypothetical protein
MWVQCVSHVKGKIIGMVTILNDQSVRYRYRGPRGTRVRLEYAAALRNMRRSGPMGRRMARVVNRWVYNTSDTMVERAAVEFLVSRGINIPKDFLDS